MRSLAPLLLLFSACASSLGGCSSSSPRVVSAVAGLPPYSPEEAAIFSDLVSTTVFGLPAEIPPAADPKLAQRAASAETIVRVRVATVSQETLAGTQGFTLSVTADERPIAGPAPDPALELRIVKGNPSISRVAASASTLVGRRFLLFLRRYAEGGEPVVHWHAEGDDPAVRAAIQRAKALDELGEGAQTAQGKKNGKN